MALDVGTALAAGDNARAVESATGAGGFWAGAATGGAIGATVGSAVPVIGTAIGGAVGSIAGGIAGSELGAWLGREFNDLVGLNEPAEVNGTIKLEVSSRDDNMDIRVRQASRHGQRNNVDLEVDTGQMMVMP